jgi:hypothetical protein
VQRYCSLTNYNPVSKVSPMGRKRSRSDSVSSSEDPASPFAREASAEVKIVHLDATSAAVAEKPTVMKCLLPPHEPLTFASFDEYDLHYRKLHMNRCSECRKNFPDERFLHLHIAENHDPISAAMRDRGEKTVGNIRSFFAYISLSTL